MAGDGSVWNPLPGVRFCWGTALATGVTSSLLEPHFAPSLLCVSDTVAPSST